MSEAETYSFRIDETFGEERMDRVLAQLMEETSRSSIQRLIESGNVCVNGSMITVKKQRLKIGDLVELTVYEPSALNVIPEDIPIDIVYEDQDLLVVNKPKGMVVHPAAGNYTGTLVNAILYHCEGRLSSINGIIRPGIVHRIDKDTSGLLVVAKNDRAHGSLAAQLATHTMKREYRAIVYNNFTDDHGLVEGPIGRDPKNRLRMAVTTINSKEAVTHYRVLERFGRFTYIEASLETGRTHQIRVHMAHINHPLLGDSLYGPKNKAMSVEGQVLHAKTLGFIHPTTNLPMEFDSTVPKEFERLLEKLRK
jgi:23S rRNA pseudouridine1911/1915/1917 synthase